MWNILTYISESLFCGAFLYLLHLLVIKREKNYQYHRIYILISTVAIAVFPLIDISSGFGIPADFMNFLEPAVVTAEQTALPVGEPDFFNSVNLHITLNAIYFIISFVYTLSVIFHFTKIKWAFKNSTRVEFDKYSIVYCNRADVPFSFMNTIFLEESVEGDDRDYIIRHEMSHIARGHSLDILAVNFVNIFQWFNPFVYLFKRALVETHEYQADRDVLVHGGALDYYRKLLLNSQFGVSPYLSSSLNKSLTLKRFRKMENLEQKRAGVKSVMATLLSLLVLFTSVSLSRAGDNPVTGTEPGSDLRSGSSIQPQDTAKQYVPFMQVDEKPKFMGGDESNFTKWVAERLVYPQSAKADTVQGRVFVQFVISEKGEVGSVKVIRSVDSRLDEEAVRVISMSPAWTPGKHKGNVVKVVFMMPVTFQLR